MTVPTGDEANNPYRYLPAGAQEIAKRLEGLFEEDMGEPPDELDEKDYK